MLELVSSDSLNVPSEEDVYRAVLSWVKHDVDTRRPYVPRVRQGPGAAGLRGSCPGRFLEDSGEQACTGLAGQANCTACPPPSS